jgi:hypothetical protein
MKICINSSELAIITGHNKYQKISDYIVKLYQKNFYSDSLRIKKLINNKKTENPEIKITVTEKPKTAIKKISKQNNINIEKELTECIKNTKTVKELEAKKQEIFKKIEHLPKEEKKEIKESIVQLTNTSFGTKNESSVINLYKIETKNDVVLLNDYYTINLFNSLNYNYYLGGKVDGITSDKSTIIEVKNRVNRLFNTIKDYENVQIHAYMKILNINKVHLIECLKNDQCKYNILPTSYNEDFFNKEIMDNFIKFIDFFERFLVDDDLKIKIYTQDKKTLEKFLKKEIY